MEVRRKDLANWALWTLLKFHHRVELIIIIMLTPVVPWLSYSPLDPRFMGSNPAGVDGFF